ncbi:MAG: phosphate signaling complex protein PhoU [Phycisphaerae bacterium]
MSELQNRLEKLLLRLDYMGMRVEQAVADAIHAIEARNEADGTRVSKQDSAIDREEVEIEQESIRLLALYQPAAIDLRKICTIIKVNNDLERIADLAAAMGRQVVHMVQTEVDPEDYPNFGRLVRVTQNVLGKTVRMLNTVDSNTAMAVIRADVFIDDEYKMLVQSVLEEEGQRIGGADSALTIINLGKALERIGDLCTNIAEDIVFLRTGDIVRHTDVTHKA